MKNEVKNVLVIDSSVLFRKIISDCVSELADFNVVGTAPNGNIALNKIKRFQPHIIVLDWDMTDTSGPFVLEQLNSEKIGVYVVFLTLCTKEELKKNLSDLHLDAWSWLMRPNPSMKICREEFEKQLIRVFGSIGKKSTIKSKVQTFRKQLDNSDLKPVGKFKGKQIGKIKDIKETPYRAKVLINNTRLGVVAIGVSTGGPQALKRVITKLPHLRVPILIVQHMPPRFTAELANSLNSNSVLVVEEGRDQQRVEEGHVYFAPGGKQMKVIRKKDDVLLKITDDPPENHCKPSVDYLFRSVAEVYKSQVLALIMTGMGADGVAGLKALKAYNAVVLAQDEKSCVVFGMPGEAAKAGVVDKLVALDDIASEITKLVGR